MSDMHKLLAQARHFDQDALSQIHSGEELLARYPAEAAQLALELRIAARLTAWGDETQRATPSASGQARAAFLAAAASSLVFAQPPGDVPHRFGGDVGCT